VSAPDDSLSGAAPAADAELIETEGVLRSRCDALAADLRTRAAGAPLSAEERDALKASIVALIRTATARARGYAALVDDAKALAALWKALPTPPAADAFAAAGTGSPNAAFPHDDAASPRRTTRADHLGASTYAAKGWTAYALGDFAAAEAAYADALALAPGDLDAAALHAWTLCALGRDDDALDAASRVLAAAPPAPAAALARVTLGRVCLRRGEDDDGFEHLTRVAHDDADRRATLYATFYLGVAHAEHRRFDDAVSFLRRALSLGPNLVEAYYALGRVHWLAGAHGDALEAWRLGAASGKFSAWGARCDDIRQHMLSGGELPPT
jgi:tetratricopeptide (TPR) repeat protein